MPLDTETKSVKGLITKLEKRKKRSRVDRGSQLQNRSDGQLWLYWVVLELSKLPLPLAAPNPNEPAEQLWRWIRAFAGDSTAHAFADYTVWAIVNCDLAIDSAAISGNVQWCNDAEAVP